MNKNDIKHAVSEYFCIKIILKLQLLYIIKETMFIQTTQTAVKVNYALQQAQSSKPELKYLGFEGRRFREKPFCS